MDVRGSGGASGEGLSVKGLFASYGKSRAVTDLDLEIGRSEFLTLLGPSGCGKTTTLRCVAGLHTPDAGEIRLDGRTVYSAQANVPPDKRDINMVFQSYAVWPHMTTLENVMYGLRAKKYSRSDARAKARTMLELVGLAEFEARHATELSGGQQQRVALARALATEPSLVLMDEPLSNLDAQLRARMRDEIRQLQRSTGVTVLYVTHDQAEALSMSDRVVVMHKGLIQQIGDPWTLYHRPANKFVATFVGEANVVPGVVTAATAGSFTARTPSLGPGVALEVAVAAPQEVPSPGAQVSVVFRPEWARVVADAAPASATAPNTVRARLVSSEFLGDHFELKYAAGEHEIRVQAVTGPASSSPRPGDEGLLVVPPENLAWFHRDPSESAAEEAAGGAGAGGGGAEPLTAVDVRSTSGARATKVARQH
ncbi:ABC transporter ATP-binding protein [Kineococcus arenarius]|uniref:ABC transporter ATP-binding protein n=1 Tax=unclassified Kineococcus TaxID=2621656 RepID=UPI003D7D12F0